MSDDKVIRGNLREFYNVEKANSLVDMKDMPFNTSELKLLDIYLSRINARDPNATEVEFTKRDYEKILGVDRIRPQTLNNQIRNLMSKVVTVPIRNEKNDSIGWDNFVLFQRSKCYQEDGVWKVKLECSLDAKKLFFDIENIRYIKYEVKNIINMDSLYSIMLYLYMLKTMSEKTYQKNIKAKYTWTESLHDVKYGIFKLKPEAKSYARFKEFNRSVLKKSVEEINNTFEFNLSYKPIKGSNDEIEFIEFTIDTGTGSLLVSSGYDLKESIEFYSEACDGEFSFAQMQRLDILLKELIDGSPADKGVMLDRYDYLNSKYIEFCAQVDGRNDISSRYAYFISIIQSDIDSGYIYPRKHS